MSIIARWSNHFTRSLLTLGTSTQEYLTNTLGLQEWLIHNKNINACSSCQCVSMCCAAHSKFWSIDLESTDFSSRLNGLHGEEETKNYLISLNAIIPLCYFKKKTYAPFTNSCYFIEDTISSYINNNEAMFIFQKANPREKNELSSFFPNKGQTIWNFLFALTWCCPFKCYCTYTLARWSKINNSKSNWGVA